MIHFCAICRVNERKLLVNYRVTETEMSAFGQTLASACQCGSIIYLDGTLGMGKTALSRALIEGLGWRGRVKSPTYTLLEHYDTVTCVVFHFDLYRLSDPEELEFIGVRDLDAKSAIWLIEWPENGVGLLPMADLIVHFDEADAGMARDICLQAMTDKGIVQAEHVQQEWEANE
ncbi:MAG: tRNA (adenosine(37)-N6)-threonylcarbamoyltransferase complex ATPase subunit type 1 TsaE [Reinekea sp.]|jgi:tRNA threonylcarbamoyladenosine biosynthesis protein TsaE